MNFWLPAYTLIIPRFYRWLPVVAALALLTACGGGGGGASATRTVQVSWNPSPATAVNRSGGGYRLEYTTDAGFQAGVTQVDVPWTSGTQTPTSTTLSLPGGRTWYFRVRAYSALSPPGATGGTQSAPSAVFSLQVP